MTILRIGSIPLPFLVHCWSVFTIVLITVIVIVNLGIRRRICLRHRMRRSIHLSL